MIDYNIMIAARLMPRLPSEDALVAGAGANPMPARSGLA